MRTLGMRSKSCQVCFPLGPRLHLHTSMEDLAPMKCLGSVRVCSLYAGMHAATQWRMFSA